MAVDRKAFEVVDLFEQTLCEYTGAPFCVTTDSCTNAIKICINYWSPVDIELTLPKLTYAGVAMAILTRGYGTKIKWSDEPWVGEYQIDPTPIVDAARWLRRGMYRRRTWTCLSFQATKHLPIGRGGAILCDNAESAEWFRRARFDGRDQEKSLFDQMDFTWGIHAYMPPDAAARGLWLMQGLKDHNDPIPATYPDLSLKRWL